MAALDQLHTHMIVPGLTEIMCSVREMHCDIYCFSVRPSFFPCQRQKYECGVSGIINGAGPWLGA